MVRYFRIRTSEWAIRNGQINGAPDDFDISFKIWAPTSTRKNAYNLSPNRVRLTHEEKKSFLCFFRL